MSIQFDTDTKAVFCYPINWDWEEINIEVTEKGIEINDGAEILPWKWIDIARKMVE